MPGIDRSSFARRKGLLFLVALTLTALAMALPVAAWTPASQQEIAAVAARLAPPDFHRQLARNRHAYYQGTSDPFQHESDHHFSNGNGSGKLQKAITESIEKAILSIKLHRPFNEIAYRAGIVSHYLADANNPLQSADTDPAEARYFADYQRYLESVEPRIEFVFYGFRPGFQGPRDLPRLIRETHGRNLQLYPLVGREYRRVNFSSGSRAFDDRSTAYAVAALSYSHAVSDIAEVLRYIWLEAGGIDTRKSVPVRGSQFVPIPRPKVTR